MKLASDPTDVSYRPLNFLGLLLCVGALAFAIVYLEGELGLEPCPLCMLVRLIVLVLIAVFLLAFLHNPRQIGQRVYATLGLLLCLAGLATSGRHIWLQSLPADEVPSCGPGLEYLLSSFPLTEALNIILQGSGECAEKQWQLFGLTLPQQSFIFFILITLVLIVQFRKRRKRSYFS